MLKKDDGLSSIIQAIDNMIEPKLENAKFDKTYRGKIVEIIDNGIYNVLINGTNYTLSYNGNLEVGNIVKVKAPLNNFSDIYIESIIKDRIINTNEESKTGYIIDGKEEYVKRINIGTLPNNTTKYIEINLVFSEINYTHIECICKSNSGAFSLPYLDGNGNITFYITGHNLAIVTNSNRTNYSGYVNLYYTKN